MRSLHPQLRIAKILRRLRLDWRADAGHALVELALMMPVFTLLIVGGAEFARLEFAGVEVANAARAGVQYGSQNHFTAVDSSGIVSAAVGDASNIKNMTATASVFCACSTNASTTISCATPATTCARLFEYVRVDTASSVNPIFHLPGLPSSYALNGHATMRVVQ